MSTIPPPRKKSPRAPSMPLDEALHRALKAYEKNRLAAAPTEVVAQLIGYKGAANGAALSALASLRYYGLLERPSDGMLAVSNDVEAYAFAPSEVLRRALLATFLRRPPLFAELLDKFASGLPTEAALKHELIQRGFIPSSATTLAAVFKRSVEFAAEPEPPSPARPADEPAAQPAMGAPALHAAEPIPAPWPLSAPRAIAPPASPPATESDIQDKIPVRLPGGRRAWLLIPTPFYESDKQRLKAQIDLLLTDEGDAAR